MKRKKREEKKPRGQDWLDSRTFTEETEGLVLGEAATKSRKKRPPVSWGIEGRAEVRRKEEVENSTPAIHRASSGRRERNSAYTSSILGGEPTLTPRPQPEIRRRR